MTHLSQEDIRAWLGGRLDAERERITSHVARCDACSRRLATEVRASASGDSDLSEADIARFRSAAYGAGASTASRKRWRWQPLAAAAVLVLAVGGGLSYLLREDAEPRVVRGSGSENAVEMTSPRGDVERAALAFAWTGTSGVVRVTVADAAAGETLIDQRVDGTRYMPTDEERARFVPGRQYHWFVEWTAAGGAADTSPAVAFAVR